MLYLTNIECFAGLVVTADLTPFSGHFLVHASPPDYGGLESHSGFITSAETRKESLGESSGNRPACITTHWWRHFTKWKWENETLSRVEMRPRCAVQPWCIWCGFFKGLHEGNLRKRKENNAFLTIALDNLQTWSCVFSETIFPDENEKEEFRDLHAAINLGSGRKIVDWIDLFSRSLSGFVFLFWMIVRQNRK